MFYFLALNSGRVISGNDISVYPVTGIGFGYYRKQGDPKLSCKDETGCCLL